MRMLAAIVSFAKVLVLALALLLLCVPIPTTWAAGGLSVTKPNGGQKWTIGKKYAIKWRKGTAGTSVRISLTKSGRHYKWISKKTRNDGRYTWKIPTSVAAGSAYKVKIKSVKKKRVLDSSNRYFTIKKKKTGGGKVTAGGNWSGSWRSSLGDGGALTASFSTAGTTFSGPVKIYNSYCFSNEYATGTQRGRKVEIGISSNAIIFDGTITRTRMSGRYLTYRGWCAGDFGTYVLRRR